MKPQLRGNSQKVLLQRHLANPGPLQIVFITGAGLSNESGIPLYRTNSEIVGSQKNHKIKKRKLTLSPVYQKGEIAQNKNTNNSTQIDSESAVWDRYVEKWCTRETFDINPIEWYHTFWFPTHETPQYKNAKPNKAHDIINSLIRSHPESIRVITQNVDGLHAAAGTPLCNLVEAHGRIGLYRCSDPEKLCIFSMKKCLGDDVQPNYRKIATSSVPLTLPYCPQCSRLCIPMFLMFDESYYNHQFFQWDKAKMWIMTADILIFAGTSFNVALTDFATLCAELKKMTIYSINTQAFQKVVYTFSERQRAYLNRLLNSKAEGDFMKQMAAYRLTAYEKGTSENIMDINSLISIDLLLIKNYLHEKLVATDVLREDSVIITATYKKVNRLTGTATDVMQVLSPSELLSN